MNRLPSGAVGDLVPAAGAVGHHDRARRGAHRRQQADLGHLHRDGVVARFVAEAAGHAAARALDELGPGAGDEAQHIEDDVDRPERLLVAMAVDQNGLVDGREAEVEAAGLRFAGHELLEQQRLLRDRDRLVAEMHRQRLVAQRQQARRLEPDDGDAGLGERQQRIDQLADARLRFGDAAARQRRASAAVVTAPAVERVHGVAGRPEHVGSGVRVLGFEQAVEGVDEEQRRLAAGAGRGERRLGAGEERLVARAPEGGRSPARQRPGRRDAEHAFTQAREPAVGPAQIGERREASEGMAVIGQGRDEAIHQRPAVALLVVGEELDLHARHVDAGRTFALAALARHAQIHRVAHRAAGEGIVAELAGEREAQRVGAAARQVPLVAGDAKARAHRAGVELAAMAVVVAHLGGLGEAAGRVAAAAR